MAFEFDHLFICTQIGAAEADQLVSFGLAEGSSSQHLGQGTANRRFFFRNAMLELLWVYDPQAAQSKQIQRTHLWERWQNRHHGICPLGICLRSTANSSDTVAFPSWNYQPPYLPKTMSISVGTNSDRLTEPMLFQIPFGKRPDRFPPEKAQPLEHPVGFREITRVEIVSPIVNPSAELQAAIHTRQIQLRMGTDYLVELGFDGERQKQLVDFRPELPLIFSW